MGSMNRCGSNNNSLYFNTVYIGGDGNGGTNKSYALYSAVNTNVRNFRNNIFVNPGQQRLVRICIMQLILFQQEIHNL